METKIIRQYLLDNGWVTFYNSDNWVHDKYAKDENGYQAISTKKAFEMQVAINNTTAEEVINKALKS